MKIICRSKYTIEYWKPFPARDSRTITMSSIEKPRGKHGIDCSLWMKISHLGRGRARPIIAKEFDAPGGLQDYSASETASCASQQSEPSETAPSDEVWGKKAFFCTCLSLVRYSNLERINLAVEIHLKWCQVSMERLEQRSWLMKIDLGAPRGSGLNSMTSEFGAMRVGSSSGRSSARSVPNSSMAEAQPQAADKRGKRSLP